MRSPRPSRSIAGLGAAKLRLGGMIAFSTARTVFSKPAIPAAPPARINARRSSSRGSRSRLPSACMMEAPTWTVGPSRPIEAPDARPSSVSKTLPTAMRSDSTRSTMAGSCICRAAMVCGMPLPWAPGNTYLVNRKAIVSPVGATMNGSQTWPAAKCRKRPPAQSAALANATATAATSTAPTQNTTRRHHRRGDTSGMRPIRRKRVRYPLRPTSMVPLYDTLIRRTCHRHRRGAIRLPAHSWISVSSAGEVGRQRHPPARAFPRLWNRSNLFSRAISSA